MTQKSAKSAVTKEEPRQPEVSSPTTTEGVPAATPEAEKPAEETAKASSTPKPAAPKSWAELLRSKAAPAALQTPAVSNGVATNGAAAPQSNSLADALATFSVLSDKKVTFLEPRGLVNTGNLCYMNSVCHSPA
jgi:ubiquitin carboxyl-terminal hydrolase 10